MVDYENILTTLWTIWNPAFWIGRSQLDVIVEEERNTHASCLHRDHTDIVMLPEEKECVEKVETDEDGLPHTHPGTSRTGAGNSGGDHDCTDNVTGHNLPNADNHWSLLASSSVGSRPLDEEDAPLVSRETIVHNRHLHCKYDKAHRMAAITKPSCQPLPHTNPFTRSHSNISAKAVIILAMALASTSINSDTFTIMETMDSPQQDHWNQAMEGECPSFMLNNTCTTIKSQEARQLRVNPIGSKWVYMMRHNPDGTIWYKACLLIEHYKQMDFR